MIRNLPPWLLLPGLVVLVAGGAVLIQMYARRRIPWLREGAAGAQLARDLTVFDKADGDRIRQSLLEHERVALREWEVAASGHSLPEADHAMQRLYAAYEEVQPHTDTQRAFLATSFQ